MSCSLGWAPEELFEKLMEPGPLLRAVQLAGAAARARDLAVGFAAERVQFGQPINRFGVDESVQALHQTCMERARITTRKAAYRGSCCQYGVGTLGPRGVVLRHLRPSPTPGSGHRPLLRGGRKRG